MNERAPPIGTMTDWVQLKRREMTGEAEGGHVALFVPVTSLWARVRSLTGRQGTSADGRAVEISHAVVFRFRHDVKPGDRIVYRGRNLDVVSAADLNALYAAADQVADFGSPPTSFVFAVAQVSPVLGAGHAAQGEFHG